MTYKCERCGGKLYLVPEDHPYHPEYYICEDCDSSYFREDVEIIEKKDNDI